MGLKLKVLAFFIAFFLMAYGGGPTGWVLAIPFLLYAFSGLVFRRWRRSGPSSHNAPSSPQGPTRVGWKRRGGSRAWVKAIGVIFLVAAFVAYLAKGTSSPYIFGILGLVILLSGPVSRSSHFGGFKPVADSIMLRGTANPFAWAALAEVKLLTRDISKALLGVSERMIVVTSERPSIYLSVRTVAPTRNGAEQKVLERLGEINKTVAPLGAYLLPLDGAKAMAVLSAALEPVELDRGDLNSFLSSTPYDLVSLETEYGVMKSIGVYRKVGGGGRSDGKASSSSIPPSRNVPSGRPLVAEVLRSVGARVEWPNPDEYLAFLTSAFATRFASEGVKVTEHGSQSNGQVVLARALASPCVELSRAQLDAIVKIYDASKVSA